MLLQLLKLQDRLKIPDNKDDALLEIIIKMASDGIEAYLDRKLGRVVDHAYEFIGHSTEIIVDRYPIETITRFELQNDSGAWEAVETPALRIRNRCVISLNMPLGNEDDQARVIYTGGYVLPGSTPQAGQIALESCFENAAMEQAVYLFNNKDRVGLSSISTGDGSITTIQTVELIQSAKLLLTGKRRLVL